MASGFAAGLPVILKVYKAEMNDFDSKTSTEKEAASERRVQHNLRVIFENACRVTTPFFDPAQSWGGSSLLMYARQTLRETYPELSQQEIALLISGVTRYHKGSGIKGS